ncbi:hypothetical protein [Nocardia flavorosea]|uniref:DUF3558 domain-containing protein n=1 Tax=Nocardia flavorosea TaxID=53429 RepID=A0A846YL64_9NOCA|nr:hypothetical protein [Nocardia flavorosea]NKY58262.1 hypothetical protein [Nocardia flavorosea]
MSQPQQPHPLPQAGQPVPPQVHGPQGQLSYSPPLHPDPAAGYPAYPPGPQWAPPPPQRSSRGGAIALVVVLVIVLLGGGGAGAYFLFAAGDSDDGPVVDTSRDLAEAPMGCGLFTESEIAPLIPGRFTTEPTGIGGATDFDKSAQCMYSNQGIAPDGMPTAFLSVTTRLHKANARESGVDKAKDDLRRKPGSPVGVPGADDDAFREIESSRDRVVAAQLFVRYRNVVITLHYTHYALGEKQFIQPLMALSALGLEKL